jgi:hypothetical protein
MAIHAIGMVRLAIFALRKLPQALRKTGAFAVTGSDWL